ncbi:MAG: hypothetical protein UT36_C0008G0057 [Candidatus Peregrinibacteria bacterium GW2011_GWF2_39_17]|nr:MAG: hypothetical protein UT36_C0008G0057 [Candidatus Peregrinibacteria bacterium GW2011_GWF2_39_17]
MGTKNTNYLKMKKLLLSQLKQGIRAEILKVDCGKNFTGRLCDLGLFEGTNVTIVKNDHFGPLILKILNSKIALGRGEAAKIYAKEI